MGAIYRRGNVWWIKYYQHGKPQYESSRSECVADARSLLRQREGDIERGVPIKPYNITVGELVDDLLADYKARARASIATLDIHARRLRNAFGRMKACELTGTEVRAYMLKRQERGAANATINRELSALRRAYSLAIESGKLAVCPHIPRLPEAAPRQGFFEKKDFERVCSYLLPHNAAVARFMYLTGWRKGVVLGLKWSDVTEEGIQPPQVPGRKVRAKVFPWTADLRKLILDEQTWVKGHIQRIKGEVIPWVFHREGEAIRDFRRNWKTACIAAGCPNMLRHDFRRTAARNLTRAGIPERVVMELVGWKTRAMLDRYNITSQNDLRDAAARIDAQAGRFPQQRPDHPAASPSDDGSSPHAPAS